jgi:hypothetical protein
MTKEAKSDRAVLRPQSYLVHSSTMSQQSPMISMPKKATEEVDWTTPIRQLISQSYGENPDGYAAECAALQRCRQDAVRGAGSDMTGVFSSG